MGINLFSDNKIPLILAMIGGLIICSNFIKLNSMRKVTLKQRTKRKKGLFIRAINDYLIKQLQKRDVYVLFLDKAQFIFGYFSEDSEVQNRRKAENMIIKGIVVNGVIFICIIFLQCVWLFKIFIMAAIILFQYLALKSSINKKKQKLKDQFPILVREFIEGYALTNNIKSSFEYIVKEIPPVYQVHVNRLINQLSSTSTVDEAFEYFSSRIDYSMCSCFVSVVQSAYSTKKNIVENLLELQSMLNDERITDKHNKSKLSAYGNNVMLWVVACIVEIFAVGSYARTSTGNYFLTTATGQNLLLFTVCVIVLAVTCINISDSI